MMMMPTLLPTAAGHAQHPAEPGLPGSHKRQNSPRLPAESLGRGRRRGRQRSDQPARHRHRAQGVRGGGGQSGLHEQLHLRRRGLWVLRNHCGCAGGAALFGWCAFREMLPRGHIDASGRLCIFYAISYTQVNSLILLYMETRSAVDHSFRSLVPAPQAARARAPAGTAAAACRLT